jgi:ATP-dependent 26S proteasome regulatory subunit
MTKQKKYKVEFKQTETFIVDVLAENETEAKKLAEEKWSNEDYQEVGDCEIEISTIYDVSETDDPFNPEN